MSPKALKKGAGGRRYASGEEFYDYMLIDPSYAILKALLLG
jgi:hypothetical protein